LALGFALVVTVLLGSHLIEPVDEHGDDGGGDPCSCDHGEQLDDDPGTPVLHVLQVAEIAAVGVPQELVVDRADQRPHNQMYRDSNN